MLTNDQLGEWEAIASKATPGPWNTSTCGGCGAIELNDANSFSLLSPHYIYDGDYEGSVNKETDADFIAMARTALPLLIAEVRRLQVDLAAMDKLMDRVELMMNAEDGED